MSRPKSRKRKADVVVDDDEDEEEALPNTNARSQSTGSPRVASPQSEQSINQSIRSRSIEQEDHDDSESELSDVQSVASGEDSDDQDEVETSNSFSAKGSYSKIERKLLYESLTHRLNASKQSSSEAALYKSAIQRIKKIEPRFSRTYSGVKGFMSRLRISKGKSGNAKMPPFHEKLLEVRALIKALFEDAAGDGESAGLPKPNTISAPTTPTVARRTNATSSSSPSSVSRVSTAETGMLSVKSSIDQ